MSIWQILLLIILICIVLIFIVAIIYLAGLFITAFISGTTLKEYFRTWKKVFNVIKDLNNYKDL